MRRAITLGGGGPAMGLEIGALKRFAEEGMRFDVWALSCIGAWIGIVYNQFDGEPVQQADQLYHFFREVYRPDHVFQGFPVNRVFAPDLGERNRTAMNFMLDPQNYRNMWVEPQDYKNFYDNTLDLMTNKERWNEGDFNHWMLDWMSVNPMTRFLCSLQFAAEGVNGQSRIYYPELSFLKAIRFDKLEAADKPFLYHNAWNLTKKQVNLFSNHPRKGYRPMSAQTLCACSALPHILNSVTIGDEVFCEGALVAAVLFDDLIEMDIDEVWVVRIIDSQQLRPPKNMANGLENLCMLFAATVGEANIELFRRHAKDRNWKGRIIEVPVSSSITYDWTYSNLDLGVEEAYWQTDKAIKLYNQIEEHGLRDYVYQGVWD